MSIALQDPAARTLKRWHEMILTGDLSQLADLLEAHAIFRSPMAFSPYQSAEVVALILRTVSGVFEDFRYDRELVSADGQSVVLEFSARVGAKQLKGIDLIRFEPGGRIVEFEVMIRPLSGLQALGEEMGRRIGAQLAAFKMT